MVRMHNIPSRQSIREVIQLTFGSTHPVEFYWTKEKVTTARSIAPVIEVDETFFRKVENVFTKYFRKMGEEDYFICSEYGNATAFVGYSSEVEASFYFIVCGFYPIATVRPMIGLPSFHFDCLDQNWDNDPLQSIQSEETILLKDSLNESFSSLANDYGYCFLPYESNLFQERYYRGLFQSTKFWDYFFYIGVS